MYKMNLIYFVLVCEAVSVCMYTMERPVLLVQVARQRVSVPLRRLKHAFLFGGGKLLAVLPEVAALASLPAGDASCQAFNVIHQLHVAAWCTRKERGKQGENVSKEKHSGNMHTSVTYRHYY